MAKNKQHNTMYKDMMVYADYDQSQIGLRIAIDHGLWYNNSENFVFLEGKIPSKEELLEKPDSPEKRLFEEIREGEKIKNRYFVIIDSTWTKQLMSDEYKEELKESRAKK